MKLVLATRDCKGEVEEITRESSVNLKYVDPRGIHGELCPLKLLDQAASRGERDTQIVVLNNPMYSKPNSFKFSNECFIFFVFI